MEYCKTVKIPVHFETNKGKIAKLDKLTARLTYAVRLWSALIKQNNIQHTKELTKFEHLVKDKSKLSSGFVQQSHDKAWWIWQQHRKTSKNWQYKISKAEGKWQEKLKKESQKSHSPPKNPY